MMKQKISDNRMLAELITGILVYGVISVPVLILIGVFCKDISDRPVYYFLGMAVGIAMAVAMAVHMNKSISGALEYDGDTAVKLMRKGSIVRYTGVTLILIGIMLTDAVSPLTSMAGLMGLKVAAYMQPLVDSVMNKVVGKEDLPDIIYPDAAEAGAEGDSENRDVSAEDEHIGAANIE